MSSETHLKSIIQLTFNRYFPFIKTHKESLVLIFFMFYPFSVLLFLQMDSLKNPTPDMDKTRIIVLIAQGVFDYILQVLKSIFLIILLYSSVFNKPLAHPIQSTFKNLFQVLIEYLRCLLPIILWGLLFIIPGVIEYYRLIWVGPLVLFSKKYHAGELDALQASREITKGHKLKLFIGVIIILLISLSYHTIASNIVPSGIFQHFLVYLGSFFIEILTAIFIGSYFFSVVDKNELDFKD